MHHHAWVVADQERTRHFYELTVDAEDVEAINERRRSDAASELARWLAGDHRPNNDLRDAHPG